MVKKQNPTINECISISAAVKLLSTKKKRATKTGVHYYIQMGYLTPYRVEGLQEILLVREDVKAYGKQRKKEGK